MGTEAKSKMGVAWRSVTMCDISLLTSSSCSRPLHLRGVLFQVRLPLAVVGQRVGIGEEPRAGVARAQTGEAVDGGAGDQTPVGAGRNGDGYA